LAKGSSWNLVVREGGKTGKEELLNKGRERRTTKGL